MSTTTDDVNTSTARYPTTTKPDGPRTRLACSKTCQLCDVTGAAPARSCAATRVRPGGRRLRLLTTIGATAHRDHAAHTPECVAGRHDRRRNRGNEHGQPAVPVVVY